MQRGREPPAGQRPDAVCQTRWRGGAHAWKLDEDDKDDGAEVERSGKARMCVWSGQRRGQDDDILARQRQRFEQEVRDLHAGLAAKGRTQPNDKVPERLGCIKERHRSVAPQYDIEVQPRERTGKHLLRRPRQAAGRDDSWATLRRKLSRWMCQTTRLRSHAGSGLGLRAPIRGHAIRWGGRSGGDITAMARL